MESRGGTRGKGGAAGFDTGPNSGGGSTLGMAGMKPKTPTQSTRPSSVAATTGGGLLGRARSNKTDIRGGECGFGGFVRSCCLYRSASSVTHHHRFARRTNPDGARAWRWAGCEDFSWQL